jgi:Ran GTPase-activating protein (RanGAP) involved in mRNA processing and transport
LKLVGKLNNDAPDEVSKIAFSGGLVNIAVAVKLLPAPFIGSVTSALGDGGVSSLARNLGSRNTTLQELTLDYNYITPTGVGVLLKTISRITDLYLDSNPIGNEGASLLARDLGTNALPNLTRLSLSDCGIGDDGFSGLLSALEQNTLLLHLDLRHSYGFTGRAFLALWRRVYQRWCTGLASALP